ncbi:MAG: HAMP domain-containing histidine kinase [Fibrobacteres bacterium]|jgi:signal transduction histidine kinase|nr:HAMP domain-containing histidine kinase [Fibrobacterota bacterium]
MRDRLRRMLGRKFPSIRLKFTLSMSAAILLCGVLAFLAACPFLRHASAAGDAQQRLVEFQCIIAGLILVLIGATIAVSLVFSKFISNPIHMATQGKILETERLASMGTLATGLAHEINNPIAGIQMCLRRIRKGRNLDPRQEEYLLLISEATDHIKCVVQDLLAYAQEKDQEKTETDLRSVLADAAKLVQPRLNRNQILLHLRVPSFPCEIPGVKSRLVQVIVNGIINSIDAIGDDGNIWVSLRKHATGFCIAVEDDGPGIAPDIAAKAFEPFFTTKGKKGTGLGLYVSFGIILAHHGRIEFRARKAGRGALLAVEFPDRQRAGGALAHSHSRG